MTRLATALLITAFAGSAPASDIYNGFARGNVDLYPHNQSASGSEQGVESARKVGVQPGVGDIGRSAWPPGPRAGAYAQSEPFRHYHDWARGNSDLYPESLAGIRTQD
ncbi:MAG: hypothetical protein MUC77_22055 [Chromatiaceae bacterium]|jgi:hypothetical protein|nr:hypothetical protein [Chromatiaceae bacterium]